MSVIIPGFIVMIIPAGLGTGPGLRTPIRYCRYTLISNPFRLSRAKNEFA